jgi:hypothetical protein
VTNTLPTPPTITARVGKMRVRNGRYQDGVRSWQRTTKLLENIETDTHALDEWKANTLAVGLSRRPDLVLGVTAAAQFDDRGKLTKESKDSLWGLRKQAMDAGKAGAGANQGNAIHTATERLDMGESVAAIGLPYPFSADLQAYDTLKRAMRMNVRPDMIERSVRNTELDIVGTADRFAEVGFLTDAGITAPGEMVVVDVKTEQYPLLNLMHICPQLGSYAYSDGLFIPAPTPDNEFAGTYVDMPNVSRTVGLVIHVRDGRATPYLVDLVSGWKSARRAAEQREELKASKRKLGEDGAWAVLLDVPLPAGSALVQDAAAPALAAAREKAEASIAALPAAPSMPAIAAAPEAAATGTVETAVRGADGLVRWEAAPPANADESRMLGLLTALHDAVLVADSMEALAFMYDEAARQQVPWNGMIAEAAQQRAGVLGCADRSFHTHPNVVKCACGWVRGVAA